MFKSLKYRGKSSAELVESLDTPEKRSEFLDYRFVFNALDFSSKNKISSKIVEESHAYSSKRKSLYHEVISDDEIFLNFTKIKNNIYIPRIMSRVDSIDPKVWWAIYDSLSYLNPPAVAFSEDYAKKFGDVLAYMYSLNLYAKSDSFLDLSKTENTWVRVINIMYKSFQGIPRPKESFSVTCDFINIWRAGVPFQIQSRITEIFEESPQNLNIVNLWGLTKDYLEFTKDSTKGIDIFEDLPKSWILSQSLQD